MSSLRQPKSMGRRLMRKISNWNMSKKSKQDATVTSGTSSTAPAPALATASTTAPGTTAETISPREQPDHLPSEAIRKNVAKNFSYRPKTQRITGESPEDDPLADPSPSPRTPSSFGKRLLESTTPRPNTSSSHASPHASSGLSRPKSSDYDSDDTIGPLLAADAVSMKKVKASSSDIPSRVTAKKKHPAPAMDDLESLSKELRDAFPQTPTNDGNKRRPDSKSQ